jgi:hypothetical protein
MKAVVITAAILVGIIAILFVVNPVLIAVRSGPGPRVEAKLSLREHAVACDLLLRDAKEDRYITELSLPRLVAEKVKIEAPEGFRAQPLEDAKSDKAWLENWNRENIRFVGRVKIAPSVPALILFPVAIPRLEGLEIRGQYETGKTFGNMISFFHAKP